MAASHSLPTRSNPINHKKQKHPTKVECFVLAEREGFVLGARRPSVRVGSDLPPASHSLPTRSNPIYYENKKAGI